MILSITIAQGKYTVQQDDTGRVIVLRYGEDWRDCTGDKLILALAQEVETLREALARQRETIELTTSL